VKRTAWSQGLSVTADGRGAAGGRGSGAAARRSGGLTDETAAAQYRRGFAPIHDRGRVWVSVATVLAAGGAAIADIDTLRQQSGLLTPPRSMPGGEWTVVCAN
jgi:hypothetical protein